MPFKFRGKEIKGTLLRHGKPMPKAQLAITHFFGVYGESALTGDIGGRPLAFPFLLHGEFATRNALEKYINDELNYTQMLENGEIDIRHGEGDNLQVVPPYKDCTCLGFEMLPEGPLEDVADTLDGGWFCYGVLHFYQLTVE